MTALSATRSGAATLAEDGYAVLPALLRPAELEVLRPVVDRLVSAPPDPACVRPHNTLVPLRWDEPLLAGLLDDPGRVGRIAGACAARDLRWVSGYVSVKDPHSPPLWWHQDWWCWDHPVSYCRAPAQVAVACYLDRTGADRGALRVLPGSHARTAPVHAVLPEAHGDASTALDPSHPALRDQPGQVTLPLRPGDAVIMDYRLLHGTHPNLADHRRDCLLLNFTPSWRGLPVEIRGHLISHPSLPGPGEPVPAGGWPARLLPRHAGPRRDLDLNRHPPARFAIRGD